MEEKKWGLKIVFFKACNMSAMVKGVHLARVDIGKAVQKQSKNVIMFE